MQPNRVLGSQTYYGIVSYSGGVAVRAAVGITNYQSFFFALCFEQVGMLLKALKMLDILLMQEN